MRRVEDLAREIPKVPTVVVVVRHADFRGGLGQDVVDTPGKLYSRVFDHRENPVRATSENQCYRDLTVILFLCVQAVVKVWVKRFVARHERPQPDRVIYAIARRQTGGSLGLG